MNETDTSHRHDGPPALRRRLRIDHCLLLLGLAAAVAWLLFRHNAHLYQWLPFLILLACPLMHVFMHRGHGGHRHQGEDARHRTRDGRPPGGGGSNRSLAD
ncbi:MAG TPA: DUF2933 domain-containing protein [Gemmatimonadaceae bacterium]